MLVVRCEPRSLVGTVGRHRKRQRVWRRELDQWLAHNACFLRTGKDNGPSVRWPRPVLVPAWWERAGCEAVLGWLCGEQGRPPRRLTVTFTE